MLDVMVYFGNIMESNMNQEIKNLLTVYENKMSSFWQLDGQLSECEDDNRYFYLESRQRTLEGEVDAARAALVAAIENLEKQADELQTGCIEQMQLSIKLNSENKRLREQAVDASWDRNPDRMGGQFTQEEIDRASRGGEGW